MRSLMLVALALLVLAPAATASTVSVDGGVLRVSAAPGETNEVSITTRVSDGSSNVIGYAVRDIPAGATPGPGCTRDPQGARGEVGTLCPVGEVQSVEIRLGDGDDVAADSPDVRVPIEVLGESGRDRILMYALPGRLADGGDGDDQLDGGDVVRGGPGNDHVTGSRLLEGGDGDDMLRKTSGHTPGRLDGGAGDDTLDSGDGEPADVLVCGEGSDVVVSADDADRPDASCERGHGVAVAPPRAKPTVTVFELPGLRSRPGRDGRLAVWMRCSVPACAVTVQIRAVGELMTDRFVRFRPSQAPVRRFVLGTKVKLVHLALSAPQRRALRRTEAGDPVNTNITASGPGGQTSMLTDGGSCRRDDPCDTPTARRHAPRVSAE